MKTLGTCSICNGAVQVSEPQNDLVPPMAACINCRAIPLNPYGPKIRMKRRHSDGGLEAKASVSIAELNKYIQNKVAEAVKAKMNKKRLKSPAIDPTMEIAVINREEVNA